MLKFKELKKYILKFVCMIMLVLIQFDVYGYDLMRAVQLVDFSSDKIEYPSEETCVSDAESMVSEWSDPVYRVVSPRSFIKAPPQELCSFLFVPILRELPYSYGYVQTIQAKLAGLSYLRFCTLLI